ncbi:oxidoreductase, partial [Proteus mirabilis]
HDAVVREGLGCGEHDQIIGFLYLGTPALKAPMTVSPADLTDFVTYF